jgi:hypothetical protein
MTSPIAAAAIAASLILAGPAAASSRTERVVVDRFTDHYDLAVDCSEFGPYSFENLVTGREHVRVIEVSDTRSGELLQTIFHIQLKEDDVNSVTGKVLPLHGSVHEVWDYAENTRTMDGVVWMGNAPGEGNPVQETGRIVMTLDTHEAFFVAGPHPAFFSGGIDPAVCGWLDQ